MQHERRQYIDLLQITMKQWQKEEEELEGKCETEYFV